MEEVTACTGNFRVHRGKWVTPKGMTSQECTYCEWCVTNGCVPLEEGYTTRHNLNLCLCDCPIKDNHPSIQIYNCGKHGGALGSMAMGRCRACFRNNATPSSLEKYCVLVQHYLGSVKFVVSMQMVNIQ